MKETVEQFVARRRSELDAEVARLRAQTAAAQIARAKIDQIAGMIGAQDSSRHYDGGTDTDLPNAVLRRTGADRQV